MPMKLEGKKAVVAEVSDVAKNAKFAMVASYRGLSVSQMTQLRVKARAGGIYLRVVRNTLARLAVQETSFVCLQEVLVGPMVLIFSTGEAGDAARLIRDFAKENSLLEIKAVSFGNTVLAGSALESVAKLPTRDQAISMLMSVMQAPVTKFVRTTAETYASLVRVVAAVAEQKKAA
jgi:large subunit ribosomal protein L10